MAELTDPPCRRPYPRRYAVRMLEKPIRSRRRCSCGTCASCLDDARWERIFSEKFEDPEYYKRRPIRRDSSLLWS